MRIAILDSDRAQAELASQVLSSARHACQVFENGATFLEYLVDSECHLLVISQREADKSGIAAMRTVREKLPALPILLVAGRGTPEDVVDAMAAGVNDYIVQPIRRAELLMRVQVLLARSYPESVEQTHIGPYCFEANSCRVIRSGSVIDLTQKEFDLAVLLFQNLDRPLSRAYIREAIWPNDTDIPSRTVDTHVSRVRTKLRLRPENGFRLVPVYSYGYRLEKLPE